MGRHPLNPSRREFLTALGGTGGAMLLAPDRLRSAEVDSRVAQIVSRTIAVDMHSHVQIRFVKDRAGAKPDPDIDLAREMKRSGFSAVCETYNLDAVGIAAVTITSTIFRRSRLRTGCWRGITCAELCI